MSLLNEMVNDLNKAKSCNGEGILLHTEYSFLRRAIPAILKALGLGFIVSLLFFALIKWFYPANPTQPLKPAQPAKITAAVPVEKKEKETPVKAKPRLAKSVLPDLEHVSFKNALIATRPNTKPTAEVNESVEVRKKAYPLSEKEWQKYTYNEALLAIEQEEYSEAIKLLKTILAKNAHASKARETLSLVYLGLGDDHLAQAEIERGLQLDKSAAGLIKLKAQFLSEKGDPYKALALMKGLHPELNTHPDFYAVLAALYESVGESDKAGGLYKELLRVEPDNGQYWLGYAVALEDAHKTQQALDAYQNAVNSLNSNTEIRMFATNKITELKG
jgi:MSHA biogenesis protein MshN